MINEQNENNAVENNMSETPQAENDAPAVLFDLESAAADIAAETQSAPQADNASFEAKYEGWSNSIYNELLSWGPVKLETLQTQGDQRFSTALPISRVRDTSVAIIGAGGLGNWIWRVVLGMGFKNVTIFDDDTVGPENIGPQAHNIIDIGLPKVEAVRRAALAFRGVNIRAINKRSGGLLDIADKVGETPDIIIGATDNTLWRNSIINEFTQNATFGVNSTYMQHYAKLGLFLDLRMSLGDWHCFAWTPKLFMRVARRTYGEGPEADRIRELGNAYRTLAVFPPEEAVTEPCTARAITYTGANVASYVGAFLHWWLTAAREKDNEWWLSNFYSDARDGRDFNWRYTYSSKEYTPETKTKRQKEAETKAAMHDVYKALLFDKLERDWGSLMRSDVSDNRDLWQKTPFRGYPSDSARGVVRRWDSEPSSPCFYVLGADGKNYLAYRGVVYPYQQFGARRASRDWDAYNSVTTLQFLFCLEDETCIVDIDTLREPSHYNDAALQARLRHKILPLAVIPLSDDALPLCPLDYAYTEGPEDDIPLLALTVSKLIPLLAVASDDTTLGRDLRALTIRLGAELQVRNGNIRWDLPYTGVRSTLRRSFEDAERCGGILRNIILWRTHSANTLEGICLHMIQSGRDESGSLKYSMAAYSLDAIAVDDSDRGNMVYDYYTGERTTFRLKASLCSKRIALEDAVRRYRRACVDLTTDGEGEGNTIYLTGWYFVGADIDGGVAKLGFVCVDVRNGRRVIRTHAGVEALNVLELSGLPICSLDIRREPEAEDDQAGDSEAEVNQASDSEAAAVSNNVETQVAPVSSLEPGMAFTVPGLPGFSGSAYVVVHISGNGLVHAREAVGNSVASFAPDVLVTPVELEAQYEATNI